MDRIVHHEGGTMFEGKGAVAVYRAITIASALTFYAKTGMKVNCAYTPSAMMRAAAGITGRTFKARAYDEAAQALRDWAEKALAGMDVKAEPFDACGFCMAYEAGELDEDTIVAGFQHLIDSGLAWSLQGHYGRTASALIDAGRCHR